MSFKKLNKCVQNATQNCLAQNLTSSGLHNDVKVMAVPVLRVYIANLTLNL